MPYATNGGSARDAAVGMEGPHRATIRRVSAVMASGRRVHQTAVGRHDHEDRVGPVCEQDHGSQQRTPIEGAEIGDEPEDPADDSEARLHYVAPLVGRLPLSEERAIVELKPRWLLGDVDIESRLP